MAHAIHSLSKQSSTYNPAGTTTLPASHTNACFGCVLLNRLPAVWCNCSPAACCRRCYCCCHSGGQIRLHPTLPFYIPQCVRFCSKVYKAVELNLHLSLVSNTVKNKNKTKTAKLFKKQLKVGSEEHEQFSHWKARVNESDPAWSLKNKK